MKTFLVKDKTPICKWGSLKDETYFEGKIPEGYKLAINPTEGYIIIDVDVDVNKGKNGFLNIPEPIQRELDLTLTYSTKRGGRHYWLKYTGDKKLPNTTSGKDIDLRTHKGYIVWYIDDDIRKYIHLVKETSQQMNEWLEKLFYYKNESSRTNL